MSPDPAVAPDTEPDRPTEAHLHRVVDRHAAAVYRVALTVVHDPDRPTLSRAVWPGDFLPGEGSA